MYEYTSSLYIFLSFPIKNTSAGIFEKLLT